ncbi:hypothetical protein BDV39DRAFT_202144 [Aspergillus sergii]|uniref:Enoyl reductase (ER) domain-containing protein n=1 Tax=Aspergillus sergii TaxID=1034303 RepID=A0A5N6XAR9_9EURO|nr:hypothetical protein BDV39DRAFT_202144 [Aspergillus sergii]
MNDFSPAIGTVGGNDFSGRVVAVGSAVHKWQIGDSICGFLYGLDPVPGDLFMRVVEDKVGMAEAACLGAGVVTAGMALRDLGISLTEGSMSLRDNTGTSGYSPITTCSPGHNVLVQSYGAVKAFDYAIRAFTKGELSLILDCITSTESMKICYAAMSARGGRYVALEPPATRIQTARKDVQTGWVMALTIFGKPVDLKGPFARDAVPGDYEWAAKWYELAEKLVEGGLLRPHPAFARSGGWEDILEGIEELRCGLVRGKKLVYAVGE